jgi:hypothetical protein
MSKRTGRKTGIWRPELRKELAEEYQWAELYRPMIVPAHAILLISWIDLPGANAQETADRRHWAINKAGWQTTLRNDFERSLSRIDHPGVINNPRILILGFVGNTSDPSGKHRRYKRVIDLLQIERVDRAGRKSGCLGLIESDRHLVIPDDFIRETVAKPSKANPLARRKVIVWVWEADDAEI